MNEELKKENLMKLEELLIENFVKVLKYFKEKNTEKFEEFDSLLKKECNFRVLFEKN
uniref:Candidate secreted effector n=1 Tax=Meloidogyne incognita TaxID=6306 RepID=A0A914LR87_MELIC